MLFAKYYALPMPVVILVAIAGAVVYVIITNVKRNK
jgi:hypothetical protein